MGYVQGYVTSHSHKPRVATKLTVCTTLLSNRIVLLCNHGCYVTVVRAAEKAFAISGRYLETEENKPIFDIKKK